MSLIARAAELLNEVLAGVPGLTVHTDPQAAVVPPALIVGAPTLGWVSYGNHPDPSQATFPVHLVESMDAETMPRLWDLLPQVAQAIDADPDLTVLDAVPTTWPGLSPEQASRPAYRINVEVNLAAAR